MSKRTFTSIGNTHFVTFSCAGRRKLLNTPRSKQIVISILGDIVDRGKVNVSGFVVMPDHVHALLWYTNGDNEHSKVIQTWKRLSAHHLIQYYREVSPDVLEHLKVIRNGRKITSVWTRRFFDSNPRSLEELRGTLKYIHENPVYYGLSNTPAGYIWSSAPWYDDRQNVGIKINPGH